jgi:hypothetical protein
MLHASDVVREPKKKKLDVGWEGVMADSGVDETRLGLELTWGLLSGIKPPSWPRLGVEHMCFIVIILQILQELPTLPPVPYPENKNLL